MDHFLDLLRGARCLLGNSRSDVEKLLKLKETTIHRVEAGKFKLLPREAFDLKAHFEARGVEFYDAFAKRGGGIRWRSPGKSDLFRGNLIRSARGLANVSMNELANLAGADRNFIFRLENQKVGALNEQTFQRIEAALNELNVELTSESRTFGAGVKFINAASVSDLDGDRVPGRGVA